MEKEGKAAEHRFIHRTEQVPDAGEVKRIAAYILNHYTGTDWSPKRYKKKGLMTLSWKEKEDEKQVLLRFDDLVTHIQKDRTFDASRFGLPSPPNNWLDSGVGIAKPDAPICASDGSRYAPFVVPLQFGPNFPVSPCIDREGVALSSFQGLIQANIVGLHQTLIDHCPTAFDLDGMSWFHVLRMLLSECVSIVDITLHQLYIKAEYGPKPVEWTFDPDRLGRRQGMRLKDKLTWVYRITGKRMDDARDQVASFVRLKDIRNHFSHFDPPCVAFTMEDVADWLNLISHVGRLLWKMRLRMGVPLSKGIVEMITLPLVEFVPQDRSAQRLPQGPDVGYRSSTWPSQAVLAVARDEEEHEERTYNIQQARSDKIIVRVLS